MCSQGSLLQGSGWTAALTEAGVASFGTANSFLSATCITKTRQLHQVTACSLYKLKKLAYSINLEELVDPTKIKSFVDWCKLRKHESPEFQHWSTVLSTELVVLLFIRSLKESNFTLYHKGLCPMYNTPEALGHSLP